MLTTVSSRGQTSMRGDEPGADDVESIPRKSESGEAEDSVEPAVGKRVKILSDPEVKTCFTNTLLEQRA